MSKTQQITDAIIQQGMLPLYFNPSEEVSLDVLKAFIKQDKSSGIYQPW